MTKPVPNWTIWLRTPELSAVEAVSLSFGVDPAKVSQRDQSTWAYSTGKGYVSSISGFGDRLMLYRRCHKKRLSSAELAVWALSVEWNIPESLASLAPPIDKPELPPVPGDQVIAALTSVAVPGNDLGEMRQEIERLGCLFVMINDEPSLYVPDGTVQGATEPLSNLYSALSALFHNNPKAKLGTMLRGSGSSGGGALPSSYIYIQARSQQPDPRQSETPAASDGAVHPKSTATTSGAPRREGPEQTENAAALPAVGPTSARIIPKGGDSLTPMIWAICYDMREAGRKPTPMPVMVELKVRAESHDAKLRGPLLSATAGGVKYEYSRGDEKELGSGQLQARINEWKKANTIG